MENRKRATVKAAAAIGALALLGVGVAAGAIDQSREPESEAVLPPSNPDQAATLPEDHPDREWFTEDARGQQLADQLDAGWIAIDFYGTGQVFVPTGFLAARPGDVIQAVDGSGSVIGVAIAPTVFVPTAEFEAPTFDWREAVMGDYAGAPDQEARGTEVVAAIDARGGLQDVQEAPVP